MGPWHDEPETRPPWKRQQKEPRHRPATQRQPQSHAGPDRLRRTARDGAGALHRPVLDGVASIAIAVLLGVVALFLARETKGLLLGEAAGSALVASSGAMARA